MLLLTLWLPMKPMSKLYQVCLQNISRHPRSEQFSPIAWLPVWFTPLSCLAWIMLNCQFDWIKSLLERWLGYGGTAVDSRCPGLNILLGGAIWRDRSLGECAFRDVPPAHAFPLCSASWPSRSVQFFSTMPVRHIVLGLEAKNWNLWNYEINKPLL